MYLTRRTGIPQYGAGQLADRTGLSRPEHRRRETEQQRLPELEGLSCPPVVDRALTHKPDDRMMELPRRIGYNAAMAHTITLRPFQPADASAVVAIINADAQPTIGVQRAVVDAAGTIRLMRYVPPGAERMVAVQPNGVVVGYCYLTPRDHATINEIGGAVHPQWHGNGIGSLLIAWAQERVLEHARQATHDYAFVLQTNLFEQETPALQLCKTHGFTRIREWTHYVCELAGPPAPPALPAGMQIRAMDLDNDWEIVGPAMDAAFANHWGAILLPPDPANDETEELEDSSAELPEDESYSNSPGFCFLALDGEQVAGGILCNAKLVERSDTGRIGSVFVHPAYQRRGIGRALALTAFRAFQHHGMQRIILDTDSQSFSDSALFYAGLGMRPYRREWLYEKVIRPGREIRRLTR